MNHVRGEILNGRGEEEIASVHISIYGGYYSVSKPLMSLTCLEDLEIVDLCYKGLVAKKRLWLVCIHPGTINFRQKKAPRNRGFFVRCFVMPLAVANVHSDFETETHV
jgi:hypothetical protein